MKTRLMNFAAGVSATAFLMASPSFGNPNTAALSAPRYDAAPPASADEEGLNAAALAADPALQERLTVSVAGRPLDEILEGVSARCGVTLSATGVARDQRASVLVRREEPLHLIMARIAGTMSHDPETARGWRWERVAPAKAGGVSGASKPAYRLIRTRQGRADEAAALQYPRERAAAMLRRLRDLCKNPPKNAVTKAQEAEDGFPASWYTLPDNRIFQSALKTLSDSQINDLMAGRGITLPAAEYQKEIDLGQRFVLKMRSNQRAAALAAGKPDPFPNGIPTDPSGPPTLFVEPDVNRTDSSQEPSEDATEFGIRLSGMATLSEADLMGGGGGYRYFSLDTLDLNNPVAPPPFDESEKGPASAPLPVYDLTPALYAPGVTDRQRGDSGFVLAALGEVAGVNIYQEFFYTVVWGGPVTGIRPDANGKVRGTLPKLLNAVCDTWRYAGRRTSPDKNGNSDYILWSRTWAQDRKYDIPERQLAPWRRKAASAPTNLLSFADRGRLALRYDWPFIAHTLRAALPEGGEWSVKHEWRRIRLDALLNDTERAAASALATGGAQNKGVPIARLSPAVRAELLSGAVSTARLRAGAAPRPEGKDAEEAAQLSERLGRARLKAEPTRYLPQYALYKPRFEYRLVDEAGAGIAW